MKQSKAQILTDQITKAYMTKNVW